MQTHHFFIPEIGLLTIDTQSLPWGIKEHPMEIPMDESRELYQWMAHACPNPVPPLLGTPFQQKVWDALCKIPFGETISYQDLAIQIGHSKAFRAVAMAAAHNPFPLVIPCHRLIRSDGSIGGYSAGSGPKLKEKLLLWEQHLAQELHLNSRSKQ